MPRSRAGSAARPSPHPEHASSLWSGHGRESAPARSLRPRGWSGGTVRRLRSSQACPGGPVAARGVTAQELRWGVRVEGALTVDDLLDRRTRLGLVEADRAASEDAAAAAFAP